MKKLIALGLAGVMTLSSGLAALAANPEPTTNADGKPVATVVNSTQSNQQTEFFLKVEDTDGEQPGVDIGGGYRDGEKYYKYVYTDQSSSGLSVTVPLYVAMYGYGKTGAVVGPTSSAYQLKNYSTTTKKSAVREINEYINVYTSLTGIANITLNDPNNAGQTLTTDAQILSLPGSTKITMQGEGQNASLVEFTASDLQAFINNTDKYYFFADGAFHTVPLKDAQNKQHVVTLPDEDGYFFRTAYTKYTKDTNDKYTNRVEAKKYTVTNTNGGIAVVTEDTWDSDNTTLGSYTLGKDLEGNETSVMSAAPVSVDKMQATPADGWSIVESETPSNAKELYMSINKVNLYEALGEGKALGGTEWTVEAGTMNESRTAIADNGEGKFGMSVTGAIAPDMNDVNAGSVSVVSVAYTVSISGDDTGV